MIVKEKSAKKLDIIYILTKNWVRRVCLRKIDMKRLHGDVLGCLGKLLLQSFLGRPRMVVVMMGF